MTAAERARRAWLDQLRSALIDAAGAAACAGLIDTAHHINAIALDIDRKTCYTDTRQRRQARKDEDEKTMKRTEAQELAAKIAAADTWNENDCKKLCELAGMLDEWNEADGETFESVVYDAAEKLGVEI